jgi:SpoVK/Ycf46/Vps4 family AAA+-type ATPase
MLTRITHYIKAGYPCLYLVSHEEQRIERTITEAASATQRLLFAWDIVKGRHEVAAGTIEAIDDPLAILESVQTMPENSLLLLRDFHLYLSTDFPAYAHLVRRFKDACIQAKARGITMLILAPEIKIPLDLTKLITPIEFSLPDRDALTIVLRSIADSADLALPDDLDTILDGASGLTTTEAEDAFALSIVESGTICPNIIAREKSTSVKKNGLLKLIDTSDPETAKSMDDIGGLDILKAWMLKRRLAMSKEARTYGIPMPKGVLIVGIPGCGKSLTAKAAALGLGFPLLQLDCGNIFASHVGESEQNLRSIIQTAESIAPCVLWLDEIEKGMSNSGGDTDGGTSARVFGSFLQWMNDKTKPVFVVATANDISKLKPEFLRKGRFDEIFFVDLPNAKEREEIWRVQISRPRGPERIARNPENFDIPRLVAISEDCTGSEIENLFVDALYAGLERGEEPTTDDIVEAVKNFVPLAKTKETQMKQLREWASGKTRPATSKLEIAQPKAARKILKAA